MSWRRIDDLEGSSRSGSSWIGSGRDGRGRPRGRVGGDEGFIGIWTLNSLVVFAL
jgi:hypothetical protein